jgi:hypothetical protein
MESAYIQENRRERERLEQLVKRLTDRQLTTLLYDEGWTVAAALTHLAFWDQRRLILLRKWQKEGYTPQSYDEATTNLLNDTLLPFFLALEPRQSARMAVSIASELDQALENLTPALKEALQNSGDRHALNRGVHRKMHLDEIEIKLNQISSGETRSQAR